MTSVSNRLPRRRITLADLAHEGASAPLLGDREQVANDNGSLPEMASHRDPPRTPPNPPVAVDDEDPEPEGSGEYEVGYGKTPIGSRFKKNQSGNPSGKSKKPRLPKHIGNQINEITAAFIGELNLLMMGTAAKQPPKGDYAGARTLARVMYFESLKKDGFARRQLYSIYFESKTDLDIFKPKHKTAADAEFLQKMLRVQYDPRTTAADIERLKKELDKSDEDY